MISVSSVVILACLDLHTADDELVSNCNRFIFIRHELIIESACLWLEDVNPHQIDLSGKQWDTFCDARLSLGILHCTQTAATGVTFLLSNALEATRTTNGSHGNSGVGFLVSHLP